jgi:hypothetical protein
MTYQFETDIAVLYGVDEAIMINNLSFWIAKNEANGRHFYEGRFWTYNSIEAFSKLFPFWSKGQIRRILNSLIDKEVIVTGNYNASARDRTIWYAFSDAFQNRQMHLSKSTNGNAETDKCIIVEDINNSSKTDNKPDSDAECGILFPDVPIVTSPKRTNEKLCLFADSKYNDFEKFSACFTKPEFDGIDLGYYFHAVADWSSGSNKKKSDWIATARGFMRRDMADGKLRKLSGTALSPDAIEYLRMMGEDLR